ncbi:hypothetical protein [Streptomyces hoynatensis]|uniref:hypothetical protein n=1 Tax=Streptomyces hoynatensis TaxID=1141874 RepID=UPI00131A0F26|nr:hypothetical protein [Streptomyces hoynatensis]
MEEETVLLARIDARADVSQRADYDMRREIAAALKKGVSTYKVSDWLAKTRGIKVTAETIRVWAKSVEPDSKGSSGYSERSAESGEDG